MAGPINKKIRGIRDPIPAGYVLGRTGTGIGDVHPVPISMFATPAFVANTTVTNQLPSGDIFVGNAGGVAAPVAVSGDITLSNTGVVSVTKIKGIVLGAGAPTDGQVLTYVLANTDAEWKTPASSSFISAMIAASLRF